MRQRARIAAGLSAAALALCAAGCGGGGGPATSRTAKPESLPGKGRPAITLGTKNFTEQFVLGQLYKQALEAKGFRIVLKNNIGPSEVVDRQLTGGRIDMYPEYTGVIVQELAKERKPPTSEQDAYDRALAWEETRGMSLLERTPFSDRDALAVAVPYAQKYGLRTTADLKRAGTFRLGGPPENLKRFQGVVGLRRVYGLNNLRYVPLPNALRYQALDSGRVDVTTAFTTDGQLQRGGYVLLSDPQGVYGFQNSAMVVRKPVLARSGPAFAQTIDAVNRQLTNLTMQRLNAAVDLDRQLPADVARQFLKASGLVGS